jgi:hypothetical protein
MTEETSPAPPAGPIASAPSEASMFRLKKAALVAEIIGAAAVVLSLVFVGFQLAQSNTLARNAAQQRQIESIRELSRITSENPGGVDIFLKAAAGGVLTPAERTIMDAAYAYAERTWEMLYYQYQNGMVDRELWEAQRRQSRMMQATPMAIAFWERNKDFYSTRYREFRDADQAAATSPAAPSSATPQPPASESSLPQQTAPEPSAPPAETQSQ